MITRRVKNDDSALSWENNFTTSFFFFFFSFFVFKYLSIESGVTVLMRIHVHDEVEFNIT